MTESKPITRAQAEFARRVAEALAGAMVVATALACFAGYETHPNHGIGYAAGMTAVWIILSTAIVAIAAVAIVVIDGNVKP